VIPPTYQPMAVSVGLSIKKGYQVDAVRQWVELILRQYLAPLPPYGPEGNGWPLGRIVRRAELEAVAVQVEGVEYLQEDEQGGGIVLWTPSGEGYQRVDKLELKRWEVPEVVDFKVVSGTPLPPDKPYVPAPPSSPNLVPLPTDVC
jgi:hypothetical protein